MALALIDGDEEFEDAFHQQVGGRFVVGREAGISEKMPTAPVEEQLSIVVAVDELAGCIQVAFAGEKLVGIHSVDLYRDGLWPRGVELTWRNACMEQQCACRTGPRLCQLLRGENTEGETGVDQAVGQLMSDADASIDDGGEAMLLGVADPCYEIVERLALIEIGGVDGVSGSSQFIGESNDAGREPMGVMKQQDLCHANAFTGDL